MGILFNSNLIAGDHIATKFCTWHDSCHVPNLVAITSLEFEWEQSEIWTVMEKSLMKWAPGKFPGCLMSRNNGKMHIWVRSRRCGCLVTWFCYQMIAKPGNKTAAPLWSDPYIFIITDKAKTTLKILIINFKSFRCDPVYSPFMSILHEGRHWANLNSVGVIGRIFKQAIIWIEKLPWKKEEEFTRRTTIIQPMKWKQKIRFPFCFASSIYQWVSVRKA